MKWTPESLAKMSEGRLRKRGRREIAGVFIDSRAPVSDGLFVPIIAARDGHDFIPAAVAAGASAVLMAPGHPLPDQDISVVEVPDTMAALHRLAAGARDRVGGPVVSITGSNGKTTTRAMVAAVMATAHRDVLCTRGNLNNHLGVPLTVLNEPHTPGAMVIELGMNAPGENDRLAAIVRPDIAVVTSVALEHLEFMGSLEAIAAAEAEPLRHVRAGGVVVVPGDEPLLEPHLAGLGGRRVIRFGSGPQCDVQILGASQAAATTARLATRAYGEFEVTLQLFGLHNARNAAAAIAVGLAVGAPMPAMIDALAAVEPVGDRGRAIVVGPHLLIADCYNANPGSMEAALQSLGALTDGRRRVAVLGDMLELGPTEQELHGAVGRRCAQVGVDALVGFGPRSRATVVAAGPTVSSLATDDVDQAVAWVADAMSRPSVVLVKGSRGMALERVVARLRERLSDRADG